jgi:hypothetical protein
MTYVHPQLRRRRVPSNTSASPVILTKPEKVYTTIDEIMEQSRVENYGKADGAWVGDDGS